MLVTKILSKNIEGQNSTLVIDLTNSVTLIFSRQHHDSSNITVASSSAIEMICKAVYIFDYNEV